jgi:NADH dehydrogenase
MIAAPQTVLVLGGSGFIGRYVVARLAALGHRITVLTRRRATARHLILLPTVEVVEGDPFDPATLQRLAVPATAASNVAGILHERGRSTFARVHVELPRLLAEACRAAGVQRLLHVSALGADAGAGPSRYLRSKGEGEAVVEQSGLDGTVFRPSVVFGREDRFLNLFARLARLFPVIALGSARARFQPVWVRDVAECIARALAEDLTIGQRYGLCGPKVYTLEELVRYAAAVSGNARPVVALGAGASRAQAALLELLPGKLLTRDNVASMSRDNVCDAPFPPVFGLTPTALEALAPSWLAPDAVVSELDRFRESSGR